VRLNSDSPAGRLKSAPPEHRRYDSRFPMSQKTPITVAHGDGIGPEIMEASLHIIQAAGAALEIETIEIGEKVYLCGNTAGIDPSSWESLRRTKVLMLPSRPRAGRRLQEPECHGGETAMSRCKHPPLRCIRSAFDTSNRILANILVFSESILGPQHSLLTHPPSSKL
jgi:hypothetical protein